MIHCVIVAFEEEALIGGAVESALEAGCSSVYVFDGAFTGYADHAESSDGTLHAAAAAGAYVRSSSSFFEDRAEKVTFAFHNAAARAGDHVLMIDADERLVGKLPAEPILKDLMLVRRDLGENDMPGIRRDWPRGDYSREGFPMLRCLLYTRDLTCTGSGRYARGGSPVVAYGEDPFPPMHPVLEAHIEHLPHDHLEAEHRERRTRFYSAELGLV